MIKNILSLAYRYLLKYKANTLLNIVGLAVGFTAFILVSLFVNYENSWDKHNANYDRIYRVQRHFVKAKHASDGNDISPHSRGLTARLLSPRFPEIEKTVITRELNGLHISTNNVHPFYDNQEGYASEQSIFQVFTYNFLAGDKKIALMEPYTIVLSETMANKLFGKENAIGKTVLLEKKFNLKVTGVYSDLPQNSTIRPTYIISLSTLEKNNEDVRNSNAGHYMTYVLLKPNQEVKALNPKLWDLFKGYNNYEDEKIKLCPMSRLYMRFNDQTAYSIILWLYQLIGFSILLLSAFNYINLTTANTAVRSKEIGVRKVHGCGKEVLVAQFLGETLLLSIIAINLAFFLTELFLPTFNNIVQKPLVLSYSANSLFILKTLTIALITGILAGLYPAFFMSSQKVVSLFKGNIFKTKGDKFSLKKVLVSFQFSISILLIIITLGFASQIKYMLTKELGFDKENVLHTTLNITRNDASYEVFRNRMLQHSEIMNCALSMHIPFASFGGSSVNWEGCQPGDVLEIRNNAISYDFINNMNIGMVEGRSFSRAFPADIGKACLINETARHCFGYDNAVGKRIKNGRLVIVGVMKDFHYKDMYNKIEPTVFELLPDTVRTGRWSFSFRVQPGKMNEARKIINTELESYFPNDPFTLQVLSETFRSENVFRILAPVNNSLLFFTILNVLLAVLGLLGLVAFTTQRRTKEIGVRKINGSSSLSIFWLLTKEYFILLLISSIISWPIGYIGLKNIPANYRVETPYWIFGFSTLLILIVALLTSLYHTVKASNINPVEALRYE